MTVMDKTDPFENISIMMIAGGFILYFLKASSSFLWINTWFPSHWNYFFDQRNYNEVNDELVKGIKNHLPTFGYRTCTRRPILRRSWLSFNPNCFNHVYFPKTNRY